jgi:hypothetical protein
MSHPPPSACPRGRRAHPDSASASASALVACLALALGAGCGDPTLPGASLVLTSGQETDAWDRSPTPASLTITARDVNGPRTLAERPWPVDSLDLGQLAQTSSYAFDVAVRDGSGAVVMRGATPFVFSDEIAGVDLPVLCGRVGELARPPRGLAAAATAPQVALLGGRYVLVADGSTGSLGSQLYDTAFLLPLSTEGALPRAPGAVATADGVNVLLVDAGGGTLLDTSTGAAEARDVPFAAAVLGGQVINGEDGTAYVVGATRATGEPTRAVLRLLPDGTVVELDLTVARLSAAATWVPGTGLLIAGGAAGGSGGAGGAAGAGGAPGGVGAELLPTGSSTFVQVAAALPDVRGAALVAVRAGEVLVVGGADSSGAPASTLRLTLSCGDGCEAVKKAGGPAGLARGRAFPAGSGRALLVGEDADGQAAAALVSDDGAAAGGDASIVPVPLRVPRRGASAVAIGDGYTLLLGGTTLAGAPALDVEIFTPP